MSRDPMAVPADARPILSIEDLAVEFRSREGVVAALRGVDLQVMPGETLGLVGESGCGKSVTAQAILRIIPRPGRITAGRILLRHTPEDGADDEETVDLTTLNPHGRAIRAIRGRDIAMVFQEPMTSLSPVHTVGNQIMEAMLVHESLPRDEARRRAIELLEMVGIPRAHQSVDAYSFELSGGMRQRAMIAIALACRPSLLIADEPTTALDVTIQAQILELLQRLQRDMGMSIIAITHNLGVIAALAQRVAVMYLGRVVEIASKERIFLAPQHPYTEGLLHSVPKLRESRGQRLWAIEGVVPPAYARIGGCAFHPRCPRRIAGRCDVSLPPMVTVAPGHQVACHLYGSKEQA